MAISTDILWKSIASADLLGPDGKIMKFFPSDAYAYPLLFIIMAFYAWAAFQAITDKNKEKSVVMPIIIVCILLTFLIDLPGNSIKYLIGAALVVIGVDFARRMHKGNPQGMVMFLIIMWVVSYFLFGSVTSIPIAIGIVFVGLHFRAHVKQTKAERRAEKKAGFSTRGQEKIIRAEERFAHTPRAKTGLEKEAAASEKEETKLVEELVMVEEHELAIAAAIKNISTSVSELEKAEIGLDQREQQAEQIINQVIEKIDVLTNQKYGSAAEVDEKVNSPLLELVSKLGNLLNALFEIEHDRLERRSSVVAEINDSISVLEDAGDSLHDLMRLLLQNEKRLSKDIDRQINDFEKNLMAEQVGPAQHIKSVFDARLHYLRKILKKLSGDIEGFKADIRTIKTLEQKRAEKITGEIQALLKRLRKSDKEMNKTINKILKEKLFSAGSIVQKAQQDTGHFFELLEELAGKSTGYMKNLHEMVTAAAGLVHSAWTVMQSMAYLNKVFYDDSKMIQGLEKMEAATAKSSDVKEYLDKLEGVESIQEKIEIKSFRQAKVIKQEVAQAYQSLSESVKLVEQNSAKIEYEQSVVSRLRSTVSQAFVNIEHIVDWCKSRSQEEYAEAVKSIGKAASRERREEKKAEKTAKAA